MAKHNSFNQRRRHEFEGGGGVNALEGCGITTIKNTNI